MNSSCLSVRKLKSLAHNNHLSLVLRYQWSKTFDVYNGLCAITTYEALVYTSCFSAVSAFGFFSAALFLPIGLMRNTLGGAAFMCLLFLTLSLIALINGGQKTEHIRHAARDFQRDFCALLRYLDPEQDLAATAKRIAPLDLDDLKAEAINVLVVAAKKIERLKQNRTPAEGSDAKYSFALSEAETAYEDREGIFQGRFHLTFGREFFFKEARRLLAEEKEAQQAPVQPAPGKEEALAVAGATGGQTA